MYVVAGGSRELTIRRSTCILRHRLPACLRHRLPGCRYLAEQLALLRHSNGAPTVIMYGAHWQRLQAEAQARGGLLPHSQDSVSSTDGLRPRPDATAFRQAGQPAAAGTRVPGLLLGTGPTVAFNLLRPDGSFVGYEEVRRLAAMHSVWLRAGCFCNPGACAKYLGLTGESWGWRFGV